MDYPKWKAFGEHTVNTLSYISNHLRPKAAYKPLAGSALSKKRYRSSKSDIGWFVSKVAPSLKLGSLSADGIKNHWLSQDSFMSFMTFYLQPYSVPQSQLGLPSFPLPWWETWRPCSSHLGSAIFGPLVTPGLGKHYLCLHHFLTGGVCWK